jgi:hypothetical protein
MKDCIQDFVESWKGYDSNIKGNLQLPNCPKNWESRLRDAGYYRAMYAGYGQKWPDVHKWCEEHVGKKHYAWTGFTFWFDSEKNAILFALRWA